MSQNFTFYVVQIRKGQGQGQGKGKVLLRTGQEGPGGE
jgi:hypothetical protein